MHIEERTMRVMALLSMLHEPAGREGSASRIFRGRPVLAWTLDALSRCRKIGHRVLICWEDQLADASPIASAAGAECRSVGTRQTIALIDTVTASRRWADGWRGGLHNCCDFDRGFHGPVSAEILGQTADDAVLLIDPAAGLLQASLVNELLDHAASHPDVQLCFSQAAPGLSGALVRKAMIEQLAAGGVHPGTLLGYRPVVPIADPISSLSCAAVPAPLARTTLRFTLDSRRQIYRLTQATANISESQLANCAEAILPVLAQAAAADPIPREIVLELNTQRKTKPIYAPMSSLGIQRADLGLDAARKMIDEISAADDARLILGGVGDPMLSPHIWEVIEHARQRGVAVSVETDLLGIDADAVDRLAASTVDIVAIFVPATSARTYQQVMGVDGVKAAMDNVCQLVLQQRKNGRGVPLIVPTFIKTAFNLPEMEPWYDHWLNAIGAAVIVSPSDFAGQMQDVAAAQMAPPLRQPCRRITRQITVLSDGKIVPCEQDVFGRQALGNIATDSLASVWANRSAALWADHAAGKWDSHPLCAACREWHRP